MIRLCRKSDFAEMLEIINDAAEAYRGIIPEDRWKEPYMHSEELGKEIEDGVVFWGSENGKVLLGIMGIQDRGDVTLIRHAYVRTRAQRMGIGTRLLRHLEEMTEKPVLIGTWAAASWAVRFYQRNGYIQVPDKEKTRLLGKYWSIPDRQVETSVVLAKYVRVRLFGRDREVGAGSREGSHTGDIPKRDPVERKIGDDFLSAARLSGSPLV